MNVSGDVLPMLNSTTGVLDFWNQNWNATGNGSMIPDDVGTNSPGRAPFIPWNNPANVITKETADFIVLVVECIIYPIVTIFGLCGNALSLKILLHHNMQSSTSICLSALAIADSLFLIMNMVRKSSCIIKQIDILSSEKFTATAFGPIFFLELSFSRISTWLIVLISIERFVAVVFPLKVKLFFTKQRLFLGAVIIYVITLISILPIAFQYTMGQFVNPFTGVVKYYISTSAFYNNNKDILMIHNEVFLMIVFRYVPPILVLILNLVIVVSMRRRYSWRMKQSTQDEEKTKAMKAQKKLTIMLVTISIIFLVCLIPGTMLTLISRLVDGYSFMGSRHNIFIVTSAFSKLLELLNSSVNFIVYMALNTTFASTYREIMACGGCYKRLKALVPRRRDPFLVEEDRANDSGIELPGSGGASSNTKKTEQTDLPLEIHS